MLAEDWARAKPVLLRALEVPTADRIQLIASEFPNEPSLRASLLGMLENYRTATMDRVPDWSVDVCSTTRTARSVPFPVSAAAEASLLTPGKSYGPYLIIRHLGSGGMGQVFLAQDVRLGRHDAVKSLAGKWLASPIARQRLLREARSAAALTHPNIATVYDVFEDGQHLLLVMEYVEGRSLRDVIGAGPVPPNYALRLIAQIADAIGYAHDRGIVHCDLKPANVQLTPEGTAKVLDFGLARATFAPDDEVSASDHGRVIGTPGYIAPELFLTGTNSPSGDVYSLGVMLFELLTGRHPFEERGPARILSILAGVAPSVTSLAPGVPGVIDGIVDRALARDPAHRYQSAHELARDLRAVLQTDEQRMLGSWTTTRGLATLGVGVILALTLAGFATSTFYNSPLGRTDGFDPESALGWPLWGIRSLVAPLGYMLLFALTFQVARVALQLVLSVPPLRRLFNLSSSLWSLLDAALRRARSRTLAAMLLLTQLGVAVLLFWRFQPIFAGLDSFVTQRSPVQLAIFSPRHLSERNDFFFLLFACVTVFGYGWYSLARSGRAYSERGAAGLIAAGMAVTTLCLFFGQVLPYRVLTKSRAERVTYRSSVCYLVGQRRDEGMLFCPLDPPPWKHVVKLDDPALKRVGRYESIFTGFD